jgi:hypothetical protein
MVRIELGTGLRRLFLGIRIRMFAVRLLYPSFLLLNGQDSGADIPWIQNITKLPLVIKGEYEFSSRNFLPTHALIGVQCVEVRWNLTPYA